MEKAMFSEGLVNFKFRILTTSGRVLPEFGTAQEVHSIAHARYDELLATFDLVKPRLCPGIHVVQFWRCYGITHEKMLLEQAFIVGGEA